MDKSCKIFTWSMATGDLLYRNQSTYLKQLVEGYEIFQGEARDKSWTGQY